MAEASGREKEGEGKLLRMKAGGRQTKLVAGGGSKDRRVTFRLEEEVGKEERIKKSWEEIGKRLEAEVEEIKKDRNKLKEQVEEVRKKEKEWSGKLEEMEKRIGEYEDSLRGIRDRMDNIEEIMIREGLNETEEEGRESRGSSRVRGWSASRSSKSSIGDRSCESESLSVKEMKTLRKWVREKEKDERKENFVIKGWVVEGELSKERIEAGIKEWLGIEIKIKNFWKSGKVLVVKLESEEAKREVMKYKFRLKGRSIYIENDLTFEERAVQGKIGQWAKGEVLKGRRVKIGRGWVKVEGSWKKWEEIVKEEAERQSGRIGEGGMEEMEKERDLGENENFD